MPDGDYEMELGKAQVVRQGNDITLVGWGAQLHVISAAAEQAATQFGIQCEVIDLQTLAPWDVDCVANSVNRTGRLLVSHEAPRTAGLAAEICSSIMEGCFLRLESPPARVCGYDTPFPLIFEKFYNPDALKILDAIKATVHY